MTPRELKEAYRRGEIPKPEYIERMRAAHQALFEYADFIRDTDIGRIEIADGRVVMTTRDPEIRLIADATQGRLTPLETLNFSTYERPEMDILRRLVREGDTVLDIGANIGWYTMILSKTVPRVTVHAFEPIPDTYRSLVAHLELNGITAAVPHNFGFGREPGRSTFFLPRESGNASGANLSGEPDARRIEVEIRRLDDFVRSEGLRPDVIKCDVEGAELHVFQGGEETLTRFRPAILAEMLRKWSAAFGYHPNEIISLMRGLGYRYYAIRGGRLEELVSMDDSTVETNFFFLHRERHRREIEDLAGTA